MANLHPLLQELPGDDLGGKSGAKKFYVQAIGKANSRKYPHSVLNEKIASELGRCLGLPIPEVLLYRSGDEWMSFSRFVPTRSTGETGPPGPASAVEKYFAENPGLMEGMVCFDVFVCNNDRKPDNLLADEDGRVWIIDQGNALFYRPRYEEGISPGIPRLQAVEENLENLFDRRHWFLDHCSMWDAVDMWCARIAAIPDYFIKATVDAIPAGLLKDPEREYLSEFIKRRRGQMPSLIAAHAGLFPKLPPRP